MQHYTEQLILRAYETGPISQWIKLVKQRRVDENTRTNEKEFLLCTATSVKKFQEFMEISEDENTDPVLKWSGSGKFFEIVTTSNKSKLVINNKEILKFIRSETGNDIDHDHWLNGNQDNNHIIHPAITSKNI